MGEDHLRTGAGLALGTVVSRLTGYLRSVLLVAALGSGLHADLFAVANTIPNMLVILLGGGVFNAVLVPQVVRADRAGEGREYVAEVITLFGGFLLLTTVALTLAAPWVVGGYLSPDLSDPGFAAQHASAVAFAYLCLPQVFLYGVFGLLGQVLNARGVFGPMAWAPVVNNLVAIGVLGTYLARYGSASSACAAYHPGQERLLGAGTTVAVLAQCLVLLPYLRRAGVSLVPARQLGSDRLRDTLRLGGWTLAVVAVNQLVYAVVVRLASGGAAGAAGCTGPQHGTGYTVYSSAYLLIMAPHAVVTVSLMTASLPAMAGLAAHGRRRELGRELSATLRQVMLVLVPVAALLVLSRGEVSGLVWGYGAGAGAAGRFAPTVGCFAVALVFFSAHYVALRGLYAQEANRAILGVQVVVGAVNVGLAVGLVRSSGAAATAPALAAAYAGAYAVGSVLSWALLRSRLGTVDARRTADYLGRLALVTALAAGAVLIGTTLLGHGATDSSKVVGAARLLATTGGFGAAFVLLGAVARLPELAALRRRLFGRRLFGRRAAG